MSAFRRKKHRILVAVLLTIGALTSADGAEPREEIGFGSNPGNLRMFKYTPATLSPAAPLIVVLHGCKQKAIRFASDAGWLAVADSLKLALLLPEQKGLPSYLHDVYLFPWVVAGFGANNQNGCFNWFDPDHTARDRGEALSIRQMIDAMVQRYSVNESRIYVVGLSAGAAMSAVMLAAYPERFAGGAIVAGVPYGCADRVTKAFECMNPGVDQSPAEWRRRIRGAKQLEGRVPRVSIWQGTNDVTVIPRNLKELVEQWTAFHDIAATPSSREVKNRITREIYVNDGVTQVESVLVEGLGHAFPIHTDDTSSCGQPGDFVVSAGICAAREITRFWGLPGN